MHSCFRDVRYPTPPTRFLRSRTNPLNCMRMEGEAYPLPRMLR